MAKPRTDLRDKLLDYVDNVYFQPPETVKLKYPCIIYDLHNIPVRKADNAIYKMDKQYDVTIISKKSDNDIATMILNDFQYCRFDRRFISDNLCHDVLTLYW